MLDQLEGLMRDLFSYDPETGELRWKVGGRGWRAGDVAGSITWNGYISVTVGGRQHMAHRVIWFIVHGYWPREIDHVNQIKSDNRIANLRECTRSQNRMNRTLATRTSQTGRRGVFLHRGKYAAQIRVNGKFIHLGTFDDPEFAQLVRDSMAERMFGEFFPR